MYPLRGQSPERPPGRTRQDGYHSPVWEVRKGRKNLLQKVSPPSFSASFSERLAAGCGKIGNDAGRAFGNEAFGFAHVVDGPHVDGESGIAQRGKVAGREDTLIRVVGVDLEPAAQGCRISGAYVLDQRAGGNLGAQDAAFFQITVLERGNNDLFHHIEAADEV